MLASGEIPVADRCRPVSVAAFIPSSSLAPFNLDETARDQQELIFACGSRLGFTAEGSKYARQRPFILGHIKQMDILD